MLTVDAGLSSYLFNFGTELAETGGPGSTMDQEVPTSSSVAVSISDEAITSSLASSIPISLTVDQIEVHGTTLSLPSTSLELTNRTSRGIAGIPLLWYSAATSPQGRNSWSILGTSLSMPESSRDAVLGIWKYIGPYSYGPGGLLSNERYPTAVGTYVAGVPSPESVVAQVSAGQMTGYGYGLVEGVGSALDMYAQWTATSTAAIAPAAASVTITITELRTYYAGSGLRVVNGDAVLSHALVEPDMPSMFSIQSLSCIAQRPANNEPYTCQLRSETGVPSGTFKGRFFGQDGKTFAGTFSLLGYSIGDNSDGMTGGLIVRAP